MAVAPAGEGDRNSPRPEMLAQGLGVRQRRRCLGGPARAVELHRRVVEVLDLPLVPPHLVLRAGADRPQLDRAGARGAVKLPAAVHHGDGLGR